MRDRKLKLLPASIYEAAATETWLADQAKRGWRPVRIGPQAAKMERSAPAECQYRLEPIDSAALIRDEALRDYYTEAGWEFVCFSANRDFRVWRSTRPDPVEIHGDPQVEAGAYRGLARRLYRDCALSVCHTLLWLFLIWPRSTALAGRLEGLAFAAPGTGALLATLIYLYFLGLDGLRRRRRLPAAETFEAGDPAGSYQAIWPSVEPGQSRGPGPVSSSGAPQRLLAALLAAAPA